MSERKKPTRRKTTMPLMGLFSRASAAQPVLSQDAADADSRQDSHRATPTRMASMSLLRHSRAKSASSSLDVGSTSSAGNSDKDKGKAVAAPQHVESPISSPVPIEANTTVSSLVSSPTFSTPIDATPKLERIPSVSLATTDDPSPSTGLRADVSAEVHDLVIAKDVGDPTESDPTVFVSAISPPDLEEASAPLVDASPDPEVVDAGDIVDMIPEMYRILDLVSDTDSSGLSMVDKIVIAQDSFGKFVNAVCPGAYQSMTRVDFATLDRILIKPLGLYGSKSEIIRFLYTKELVGDEATRCLREGRDDMPDSKRLRPGLYLLRNLKEDVVYVIFWPQDSTWDDDAGGVVQRNRVTFIRYLTKIADQIMVLISDEHADTLTLANQPSANEDGEEDDVSDRLFSFEVAKTRDEEENVTTSPGFRMNVPLDASNRYAPNPEVPQETLAPRLVSGDSCIGLMTTTYMPAMPTITPPTRKIYQTAMLRTHLKSGAYQLDPKLSEDAFKILLDHGLGSRSEEALATLKQTRKEGIKQAEEQLDSELRSREKDLRDSVPSMTQLIRERISTDVAERFTVFAPSNLWEGDPSCTDDRLLKAAEQLERFGREFPDYNGWIYHTSHSPQLTTIGTRDFMDRRSRLDASFAQLASSVMDQPRANADASDPPTNVSFRKKVWNTMTNPFGWGSQPGPTPMSSQRSTLEPLGDVEYLGLAVSLAARNIPVALKEEIQGLVEAAQLHLSSTILLSARDIAASIEQHMLESLGRSLRLECSQRCANIINSSRAEFIQSTRDAFIQRKDSYSQIVDVQLEGHLGRGTRYSVHAATYQPSDESLKRTIQMLTISKEDEHELQLNHDHIPAPKFSRFASTFHLPISARVLHVQLLHDGQCLLIVRSAQHDEDHVYLEELRDLAKAIEHGKHKKSFAVEKFGTSEPLLSFNETKGQLCLCVPDKLQLHLFAFDEDRRLRGLRSTIELSGWYDPGTVLDHIVFLSSAAEELVIVDGHRARIFSLVTQQFRPASVSFAGSPSSLQSSPDGSCLLAMENGPIGVTVTVYHVANFGSSPGIALELPGFSTLSLAVTSFVNRNRCHVVNLDPSKRLLESTILRISHKSTEFMLQTRDRNKKRKEVRVTKAASHNCLLDCHRDVWTRFPVVPAIQRYTTTSSRRHPRALVFVSKLTSHLYTRHFSELVFAFETSERKPAGDELSNIRVTSSGFEAASHDHSLGSVSVYQGGEWLVDILCLIPIQIAITRKNGFYPLQDGVWSQEFEHTLLGATVEQVIDSLSFGWYESIFESYMALKPMKVISSMGEQSVGKSFALNHIADTSFAMSAMRTTDGVWMSVTPTEDSLVVALDFEGVHSIERSIQEDSLMVLFNTAISNLVIFRNNFAFSRDISSLFQSFQSSATVLDPKANPMLFKSTLCIVIKDVIDADTDEIRKEFALKFQQMIDAEQGFNFITRLHGGSVMIVPWPVIQTRKFYALFPRIKAVLDEQAITYPQAGIFLQTIKTLMAKLRTNDWGSLSQNMALHRAHLLQNTLPLALEYGAAEIDPMFEPLKDIDSGKVLDTYGLPPQLHVLLSGSDSSDQGELRAFVASHWDRYGQRAQEPDEEWVDAFDAQLSEVAQRRIDQVQHWLDVNTSRFKTDHANFQDIRRHFETLAISLKVGVQLCKLQCAKCHLLCLQFRHHDGSHDCHTDHKCPQMCGYSEEHASASDLNKPCGLPGGHSGDHICDIARHRCGKLCRLSGKVGCLERCSKMVNHPDEKHVCPAKEHECGMPCMLSNVRTPHGALYTCQEVCRVPSETPHDKHVCRTQSCPLPCQLCKRLCADANHLHATEPNAVHLCGQSHVCSALCQMPGTCRIDLTPHSVETTFTGRHDTFLFTKYTQVAKHLQCIIPVPSDRTEHDGPHRHTDDPKEIHHCETRCDNCGYFCTLPFGHPQQEHETSHGSMSRTRWAVEGGDDTVVEVNGRKFGSGDDGAPLLCSMVCQESGRHLHIDYCRTPADERCAQPDLEHIHAPMSPNPELPKDWVTHELYWRRRGFKDPYLREQRLEFAKCAAECPGREHRPVEGSQVEPSKCTLPVLHAPLDRTQAPPGGIGYISGDGHHFTCMKPDGNFHVVFVIDRSGSMSMDDHRPLADTPVTARLRANHDNRLGAVLQSLHAFWRVREAALQGRGTRGDAYSMVLFNHISLTALQNDTTSTPDELLQSVLRFSPEGGTDFSRALWAGRACVENNWDADRAPVLIFLSDGEGIVDENLVRGLCHHTASLGKPLSLHAVAFGPYNQRLRTMTDIAQEVAQEVLAESGGSVVQPSFNMAQDTVRLAETFVGIAQSLTKPRGALIHV